METSVPSPSVKPKDSQYLEHLFIFGCLFHCLVMNGQNDSKYLSNFQYF